MGPATDSIESERWETSVSIGGDSVGDTAPPPDRSRNTGSLNLDQIERADRLRHLKRNGPTIAELYLDAASRVDTCVTEAKMAVLSHCVREILNRLPGVLGYVFDDYRQQQKNDIERLVAAAENRKSLSSDADEHSDEDLERASRDVDDSVAAVVTSFRLGSGENRRRSRALVSGPAADERVVEPSEAAVEAVNRVRKFFTDEAHIGEEPGDVPALVDIRRHFALVESTLDQGLAQFWRGHQAMREILARANTQTFGADGTPLWSEPSDTEVLELALALNSPPNAAVFFDELDNPAWLEPLQRKNVVSAPRPPTPVDTGGVTFPVWPEGGYLARMASERPDEVTRFFLDVDLAGNGLAGRHLVEAAIALPVESAVRLTSRVIEMMREPSAWLNPERLVVLVEHLRTASSTRALKQVVAALFVVPSALDNYWYAKLLPRAAQALRGALGAAAVSMLVGFLHEQSAVEDRNQSRGWRSEVAHSREDFIFEIGNALVDSLRDVSLAIVAENPSSLREVVDELLVPSIQSGASARVAMLVVTEAIRSGVDGAATIGQELLLNPSHLAWEYEPELSGLGQLVLEGAAPEVVDAWIAVVESDPEFADTQDERVREIAARFANVEVAAVTDEHIERLRSYRVREHLALMEGSLPDNIAARLSALDAEFGARPARRSWGPTVTSFIGPTSPHSTEELEAMSDDELIDYLKEWRVTETVHFGPTPEGLGRQLGVLAERQPERLFALADRLTELSPTYLRHVLQGWEQAIRKSGVSLGWEQVIKVILFIAEKPDEGDVQDRFDEDSGWRATQQAAASLLDEGLRRSSDVVPGLDLRSAIWSAIQRLSLSPDPTPVREAIRSMDAESTSINSVRPYAVSAAVMYLWWLVQAGVVESGEGAIHSAPEVWDFLDKRLDPQFDPSAAVQSTLGLLYPFLASVSPTWARDSAERLFVSGGEDGDDSRTDAAWDAYVRRAAPNKWTFEILTRIYFERLRLSKTSEHAAESRESTEARTAEHVLLFYRDGLIKLDSDDGLMAALFANYTPQMRAHVLGHFGWLLFRQVELNEEQVLRLQALWEWRRLMVDGGEDPAELAGFGWWFRSGKFPIRWAASQLAHAASLGVTFDGAGAIIEDLAVHAGEVTADAVTTLEAVTRGREPWEVHGVGQSAAPIIAAGLDSSDTEVRERADDILQTLGAQGHLSLHDDVAALRVTGDATEHGLK